MSAGPDLSIAQRSERVRRLVHFCFGGCVLLIPLLGRAGSAALASAALLYNAWLAPRLRLDRAYRRANEARFAGLTTYPLAVLALLLVCPLAVAAGAWVVLATADPVAAAAGSRWPRPRVPGHARKSLVGGVAGFAVSFPACALALCYMDVPHPVAPAACAAAAGAAAEALPLPFDDNLAIAAASALVLLGWLA